MIIRIQIKEYNKLEKARKDGAASFGFLIFKAENGFAYKCDKVGMVAVKEIAAFTKEINRGIKEQASLL